MKTLFIWPEDKTIPDGEWDRIVLPVKSQLLFEALLTEAEIFIYGSDEDCAILTEAYPSIKRI